MDTQQGNYTYRYNKQLSYRLFHTMYMKTVWRWRNPRIQRFFQIVQTQLRPSSRSFHPIGLAQSGVMPKRRNDIKFLQSVFSRFTEHQSVHGPLCLRAPVCACCSYVYEVGVCGGRWGGRRGGESTDATQCNYHFKTFLWAHSWYFGSGGHFNGHDEDEDEPTIHGMPWMWATRLIASITICDRLTHKKDRNIWMSAVNYVT